MAEPLACAVHGLRRLGPVLGESVVVVGAGTMGLLLLQLLVRAGAGRIAVVDRISSRLEVARNLGAGQIATSADELDGGQFGVAVGAPGGPAGNESADGPRGRRGGPAGLCGGR